MCGGINIRVVRCATFSKTFNSPKVTLSENPIMIYDSIESWLKTIIQCYKQRIYHIDRNGFLQYDRDREPKLSREMNPKSVFWKLFD